MEDKEKKDSVDLKIKGVNPGKARIMVSNTLNKKKIYINVKITGKKNFETKEDNINRLKQYIISNGKTDEDDDGKQYYYCTFSGEEIIETIQKNDSFDFDISWPIDPSNKIRDSITSMSNSSIHMLLSSFNYIFLRHFGFSMNEIGFNSYV